MPKLCLVFISISLNLLSQNIVLTDSTQKSALRDQLKLFVDSGKEYTIDELVNQSSLFKKIDTQKLLFGYTDSAIWLYLRITNQSTKNWVLSLPRPSLRYVDFYRIDSNRITHTETGFYRPFHQRDYNFVDFAFPVKQNITNDTSDYYLRIENVGRTDIPLQLITETEFIRSALNKQFIFGLFYGLLLIMIGYNFVLTISLSDSGYLNYSLFLFFITIAFACLDTVFQQYILPDYPIISATIFRIAVNLCLLFSLRYANDLLRLKTDNTFLYKLSIYLQYLILAQTIIGIFYYDISIQNALIVIACILMLYFGFEQWRNSYRPAKIYLAGWLVLLISAILLILPIGEYSLNMMRTGMAIMVMLLSIALSDRIRILRQEKLKIQENLVNEKDKMLRIKDELNESLKQSMTELESKNSELEQFTYTVSHDLKNPLFTIQGYLGQLRADALKGDHEAIERDMNYIGIATKTMNNLLEDLLNLSRIGYKMNPPESIELKDLITNSLKLFAKQIDELNIKIDLQKSYPLVFGDRIRLFEVFQNLIANAIKFSQVDHPNQISIKAKVIGHRVRCSITDEGIGVDPQYSERVFTLFEQLNPNGHGTGIGLSIVKRIIEIHDGKIWLESKGKNKGCTFYFELPKS